MRALRVPMQAADPVEFIESSHQYFVAGIEYPSVSTVLQMFTDLSRVPRAVLEHKRQIGRAVHAAIALGDELDLESLDPEVAPYYAGWVKFKAAVPGEVVAAEQIVYSKKHRCAGRLDINYLVAKNKTLWQIDAKCVDTMSPATALQTSGYQACWNEMHPDERQIRKRGGLQLLPNGEFKLYPYNNRNDFGVFLNALNIYRWRLNNT